MKAPLPANETKRLEALRRYRILDTPAEDTFDDFALIASTVAQTPIAIMTLLDEERQWFKAKRGLDASETPRDWAFCAHTILRPDVMVVNDATMDPRFADNPLVTSGPDVRFYAGAPLIDHEGHALGALCVIDRRPREFSTEQQAALQALARTAISQLEFRKVSAELVEVMAEVQTVRSLLPMCAHCKGIRNDEGYWQEVEQYLGTREDVDFSHGVCPSCLEAHYPKIAEKLRLVAAR